MNKELLEILLKISEESLCTVMPENLCVDMHCVNCIPRMVSFERTYPETIKVMVNE